MIDRDTERRRDGETEREREESYLEVTEHRI